MIVTRKLIDQKYSTCITSSVHLFISDFFEFNKAWKECFDKLKTEIVLREFTKILVKQYIETHKSYKIIKSELPKYYELIIYDLIYNKLFKIKNTMEVL